MAVTAQMVKELRDRTGAGFKECRDILAKTDGNMDRAIELLREKGIQDAGKKEGRVAAEGRIEFYVHPGERLGAMIELNCETDFVARTEEFIKLSRDLALHIVATNPHYIKIEDVPSEALGASELSSEKFYEEHVLLAQPFIKNPTVTIQDMIKQHIAKLGENIVVSRFARYEVGGR